MIRQTEYLYATTCNTPFTFSLCYTNVLFSITILVLVIEISYSPPFMYNSLQPQAVTTYSVSQSPKHLLYAYPTSFEQFTYGNPGEIA